MRKKEHVSGKLVFVFAMILTIFAPPLSTSSQELIVFTEEFPPYNYTKEGKITGASTEVVQQVLQNCGFAYTITSYPWARSYTLVQQQSNSLIYSIGRRKKREELFKWIGEITPIKQSVFALQTRTDIKIDKLDELKNYTIGTTIEDARETWLLNKGFARSTLDSNSGNSAHSKNFQKLLKGRIDLWPMPDAVAYHIVRETGFDPQKILKRVFPLEELSTVNYMAASLLTSDKIVFAIADELEKFKQTEEYALLLKKWDL